MLALPIASRPAIHFRDMVVSARNRRAITTFWRCPLRCFFNSSSFPPNRLNYPATIASAFAAADSRNSSP